jgi:RNA polymerase sigma-70 factor, ECF subfamily
VQVVVNRAAHENELSEAELVERAQRGESAALAELVSRYQDRIYNVCYRMCHDTADALDLAQATFLKALEALPRFQRHASFFTWLFRIALNVCISHRRQKTRHRTLSLERLTSAADESHAEIADKRAADVAQPAEQREQHARIEWALAQLDEEFRAAVILKDIEELDYAAIADILCVPVGTVKSRIHRGRLLLHELLKGERTSVERA